jgi:hypothetical protein
LNFWRQVRDYLMGAQFILACHALRSQNWDSDQIGAQSSPGGELDAESLDDAPPDEARYRRIWGDWVGREEELYTKTYELVSTLDRETFASLGGIRQSMELDRLEKRYNAMQSPVLPDPLLKSPTLRVNRALDGSYILTSYTGSDPSRVRKGVYELLDYFDGRVSTAAVQTAVFQERGVWLSEPLLTKLYQHRILIDPRAEV